MKCQSPKMQHSWGKPYQSGVSLAFSETRLGFKGFHLVLFHVVLVISSLPRFFNGWVELRHEHFQPSIGFSQEGKDEETKMNWFCLIFSIQVQMCEVDKHQAMNWIVCFIYLNLLLLQSVLFLLKLVFHVLAWPKILAAFLVVMDEAQTKVYVNQLVVAMSGDAGISAEQLESSKELVRWVLETLCPSINAYCCSAWESCALALGRAYVAKTSGHNVMSLSDMTLQSIVPAIGSKRLNIKAFEDDPWIRNTKSMEMIAFHSVLSRLIDTHADLPHKWWLTRVQLEVENLCVDLTGNIIIGG